MATGYNAWTGNQWAAQYGRAYNSVTGTSVVGRQGAVQNVYSGNYASGGRAAFYNNQTGAAGTASKVNFGNANTGKSGTVAKANVYNPNTGNTTSISAGRGSEGNGFINVNGNVIVGKDGNYYRPNGSGGWDQITKPPPGQVNPTGANGTRQLQNTATQQQWNTLQQSAANQQRVQSLNNQYNAQRVGAQRQQSFQMNRPAFRGGGGRR
jgi:hypothetical protein